MTTELLGLAAARVGNEEGSVVSDESVTELVLGGLIDVLSVPGDDTLGDGLAESIDLSDATSSTDLQADVDVGEL